MIIQNLQLKNFRIYDNLNINLSPRLNIIIGDNAQGKTSILEAIYILGITKSPITTHDQEFIKYNQNYTTIKALTLMSNYKKKIEISVTNNEKQIKINGKKQIKIREYISKLNIILFSPYDLEIIKGSPNIRRKFLNIEIGQLDNNYLNILSKYNKILKTRNEYLKQIRIVNDYKYLEAINEKYIEYAIKIYEYRFNFIVNINNYIGDIFKEITGFNNIKINYLPNIKVNLDEFKLEKVKNELSNKIQQSLKKEILLGTSIYGPHRDDFSFFLNDKNLGIYGSQGQQRCAIISLKLAEINLFYHHKQDFPIVLLDDIFSELDKQTRNRLLNYLNKDIQIIITTNDLNSISKKIIKDAQIKKIKNGKIEER